MNPYLGGAATLALVVRAYRHKSLTTLGIAAAVLTAIAHIGDWSVFFALLIGFFLAGNAATKAKHAEKSRLTQAEGAAAGGTAYPAPRTATQVLSNSLPASIALVAHAYHLKSQAGVGDECLAAPGGRAAPTLLSSIGPNLPYAVYAHYAAVAADTLSSELGILSKTDPILITDVLGLLTFNPRRVPRGTNGGVTVAGLVAGAGGAALMAVIAVAGTPFCAGWTFADRALLAAAITALGTAGSILDSVLGALTQATVVDAQTGKVVEGEGGVKVRVAAGKKRVVVSGWDVLSNNGVNLLMCSTMSVCGLGLAILLL